MFVGQSRCSHLKSVCYFALSLMKRGNMFLGIQCTDACDQVILSKRLNIVAMGIQTPEW